MSIRNVPGSKWWLLPNVLVCVGKTGEKVANWNNSRPWIKALYVDYYHDNILHTNHAIQPIG